MPRDDTVFAYEPDPNNGALPPRVARRGWVPPVSSELRASQLQVALLRGGLEFAVRKLNKQYFRAPEPWIELLARTLRDVLRRTEG